MPITKHNLNIYKTIIFDCDGVILNSNKIKSNAFYDTVSQYNLKAAEELLAFHVSNGGKSRYIKFDYFVNEIAPKYCLDGDAIDIKNLLERYKINIKEKLLNCEVCPYLDFLKSKTPKSTWMVVSGSDQEELRYILDKKNIAKFFNGGIYGSPDSKDKIISREIEYNLIKKPALFIGDSKYDHLASSRANIDFIFLYKVE